MFYQPFSGNNENHTYMIYGRELNVSNEEIHNLTIAYDGEIRFVDDNLALLFKYLNESGMLENTIIIITADHGESLGEHFIFDHNALYWNILHVPLIIRNPKNKPKVISQEASLVDLFPTILDTLGIKDNSPRRGKNLFFNRISGFQFAEYEIVFSLKKEKWKVIANKDDFSGELFNVKFDPDETTDLKNESKKIYEELVNSYKGIKVINESGININTSISNEILESLRKLGYIR
jgi:arylsulfatase A-like enzyme